MLIKQTINAISIMLFLIVILGIADVKGQSDEGFIYGKITTWDDNTYKGPIRWGDEEVFWSDMFNSTKTSNENLDYLSRRDRKLLDKHSHSVRVFGFKFNTNRFEKDDHEHVFVCQFGEIKTIDIIRGDRVEVEFKNGEIFDLEGGSNDIETEVLIFDEEIGEIEIDWRNIDKVEFMKTPSRLENKFGEPLYGIVDTHFGEFTGCIQWDHDERLSTDELDGETRDGDVEIKFGNIKSIEREGRKGSTVILKSGRELYVDGSNDVDDDNRGIIVTVPKLGRVDIEWRDFKKVVFKDKIRSSGLAYDKYPAPQKLYCNIETKDGKKISGEIVYDLDEAWDFELLHGTDSDLEYLIPFRNVKKIVPNRYRYSKVQLKNGQKLRLGERQDVTEDNDGVLIFADKNDPEYIPWKEIKEIEFKD